MKACKKIIFTAVLLCAVSFTMAKEPEVISLVRKNYSGKTTVTAQFDLTIYWAIRERESEKRGELFLAPGEKFRADLGKETFVSDGKSFWQYSERNSQVVVRNLSEIDLSMQPSHLLSTFLTGRTFTQKSNKDGVVELVWKNDSVGADSYKSVTALVEEKTGIVKTLELVDKNENVNTYTFKNTVVGKPIADKVFRFKAPKGVEVLDMRENNAPN
ncbi:MAG: LolA family protein [Chitinispirillaceae bacterium]